MPPKKKSGGQKKRNFQGMGKWHKGDSEQQKGAIDQIRQRNQRNRISQTPLDEMFSG